MTLWALLSDVHGRGDRLARVLADIEKRPGTRVVALGDIASTAALEALHHVNAQCVFGNWEASGLRGLPAPYRSWVARWPAVLELDGFCVAHASPVWPANLAIGGVVEHLRSRGMHWTHLFPSLQHSESARLAAFGALETAGLAVFFHGHTHTQEAWQFAPGEAPRRSEPGSLENGEISLTSDAAWLVGIGSVGDPHDGPGACYALYDPETRLLTWRRV